MIIILTGVLVTMMLFIMAIMMMLYHGDHDDAEHGDLDDDKVSVVGWCGACVACCFSGKGLCTLFGKLPSVCKVNFSFTYIALNLLLGVLELAQDLL